MGNIFERWKRNRLPDRLYYKLEGDIVDAPRSFGRVMDYRASQFTYASGADILATGQYQNLYNAGPQLNTNDQSFGFPGDYTDYYGLN